MFELAGPTKTTCVFEMSTNGGSCMDAFCTSKSGDTKTDLVYVILNLKSTYNFFYVYLSVEEPVYKYLRFCMNMCEYAYLMYVHVYKQVCVYVCLYAFTLSRVWLCFLS